MSEELEKKPRLKIGGMEHDEEDEGEVEVSSKKDEVVGSKWMVVGVLFVTVLLSLIFSMRGKESFFDNFKRKEKRDDDIKVMGSSHTTNTKDNSFEGFSFFKPAVYHFEK